MRDGVVRGDWGCGRRCERGRLWGVGEVEGARKHAGELHVHFVVELLLEFVLHAVVEGGFGDEVVGAGALVGVRGGG